MPVSLHYRVATAADITAMSVIRLGVSENRLSDPARVTEAMYHDYLGRLGRSWVCLVNDSVVGFSSADQQDGSIWALFLDPHYQGKGIGTHLLALAVAFLFEQGHTTLVLATEAGTRADRFYGTLGWQRGAMKDATQVLYSLQRTPRAHP